MNKAKPFYDLCIQEQCISNFSNLEEKLIDFGFKTIAINQIVDDSPEIISKKKKKGDSRFNNDPVPAPISIKNKIKDKSLTVLNRLTVTFSDKGSMYKLMQSENFKKYDIFAVVPKTHETFQAACETLEIDIISFDPTESKWIKLSRKLYNVALERNIHFEIMYTPAIIDQTCRKNIIARSHNYHAVGKSRNVIITSGAYKVLQIRGPYDITNLGLLFGLSEEQSKYSISTAGTNVLNRAMGRRIGKTIVIIKNLENNKEINKIEEIMEVDDIEEPIQKKLKTNQNIPDEDVILLDS